MTAAEDQLELLTPPAAAELNLPVPTAAELSHSLTPTPHKQLQRGTAMQGTWRTLTHTYRITLWCNPTLAPIPAPPEQTNTWIVTRDDQPLHTAGLPHRKDALRLLAEHLAADHPNPNK